VSNAANEVVLADMTAAHGINAGLFVPFVIRRLEVDRHSTEAALTISLRDIVSAGTRQVQLLLRWSPENRSQEPLGIQEHVVTEWAALGVACAVVQEIANLRVQQVTAQGDRFDYWVSDGDREFALEVSGTLSGDVEERHRAKVRQWRDNPYRADGYVVVVGFAAREVVFSFHRFSEAPV
jgi:hypothetical protein